MASPLTGNALVRAVRAYRKALYLALDVEPEAAVELFHAYDARIPTDQRYVVAGPQDERRLATLLENDNLSVVSLVFEVASRSRLGTLQGQASQRLAEQLGQRGDANGLVAHFERCRQRHQLDATVLACGLRHYVNRLSLEQHATLWTDFFAQVPSADLPPLFEVHRLLGRGVDAVALSASPAEERQALVCCRQSPRLDDVEAGLGLARRRGDTDEIRILQGRAGELLVIAGDFASALVRFQEAQRLDGVSDCHERLGQFIEALAACPLEQPDRRARLAARCLTVVDEWVAQQEYLKAAELAQQLHVHLLGVAGSNSEMDETQLEATTVRDAVRQAGRDYFTAIVQDEDAAGRRRVLERWSRFEELLGEFDQAARLAEDVGDQYRAYRLYGKAERHGEAFRVRADDLSPAGLADQAAARAAGGDLVGAARLRERAGEPDLAVALFIDAEAFADAARCLVRWRGDEAVEDPRLADCLRRAGELDELARRCLAAIARSGSTTRGVAVLDELLGGVLSPDLERRARTALDEVRVRHRSAFQARAEGWVARARAEIDRRYAGIWGLDLGTTTCSAALYDRTEETVVLCSRDGSGQFPSTLALDRRGVEIVGLTGEELLAAKVAGSITGSKRRMGTRTVYRIGERRYRPEEVAARLIRHARTLVEDFLAAAVRERVGELARAELGESPADWLSWLERHYDLRLDRPRAVVTIPAYFGNNQKHATRDACQIAGIEVVRLLHEPTAACLAFGRAQRVTDEADIVVVDLGAGTLDLCSVSVVENVYEVIHVLGNNHYGSRDFDAVIGRFLLSYLEEHHISVPERSRRRARLEVAAEYLKIALSFQERADYLLRAFAEKEDVRLELSREQLADLLAEPLQTLKETCIEFKATMPENPAHLVLVGGPMLSPLVREAIERVFQINATTRQDPRTAVVSGAALQAAVHDGVLRETLLLDVTPLPLGILVLDEEQETHEFSTIIEANTTIPTKRTETYTTVRDGQMAVNIEIFQGRLDSRSKIGHFSLQGIAPAPKGAPSIEVTFSIDANCVLEVTACDKSIGVSSSIRLTDTTLLSPVERREMFSRYTQQQEQERRQAVLRENLTRQIDEVISFDTRAAFRELRSRMASYRAATSHVDPEMDRALREMFTGADELEVDLLTEQPLHDLAATADELLRRDRVPDSTSWLAEAEYVTAEMGIFLSRVRPLRTRLTEWIAVLRRAAETDSDPLHRFINAYAVGDFRRALETFADADLTLEDPGHIRVWLACLARVGDADTYRSVLLHEAPRLERVLLDPVRPAVFLAQLGPALGRVQVDREGEPSGSMSGFLISDRLVVTNRRCLVDEFGQRLSLIDAGRISVQFDGHSRRADRVLLPDSTSHDLALIQLADPVPVKPLQLGYPELVRVGDRVWIPTPPSHPGNGHEALHPTLVDRFEIFPEQALRLLKLGIRLPASFSGVAVLNELGEVVGILNIGSENDTTVTTSCFALTIDALEPLFDSAGLSDVRLSG